MIVAFKIVVACLSALLGAWALGWPALTALSERRFLAVAIGIQLIPAMALFVALYVIGHQEVASDVPGYYLPAARAVLAGQVPYREFSTSYAPLFPYIGAGLVYLWNSGKVFAVISIAINALTLLLWHTAAIACFDSRVARQSSVLYATSGHILLQSLLGTSQSWIAAALAGSTLLIIRGRTVGSGLLQGFAASTTKVLALLFWPVLWICAPRRVPWLAASIALTGAVYGLFAAVGGDLLDPLHREGAQFSSGNIPYVLEPLLIATGQFRYPILDALALATLAGTIAWLYLQARPLPPYKRPQLLLAGIALTGIVFMAVSKKTNAGYAVFVMYPAILVLTLALTTLRARVAFLLAFNVLLAAEPSLWFRIGKWRALSVWLSESGAMAASGFVLIDLALIACYVYVAWLSMLCVRSACGGQGAVTESAGKTC